MEMGLNKLKTLLNCVSNNHQNENPHFKIYLILTLVADFTIALQYNVFAV